MTTEIDVRDRRPAEYRDRLYDAFDGAEAGEEFEIVSDSDLDPQLVRYQLDRDRALRWEYADPDAEPRELAVTVGEPLDEDALPAIDVRDLKPQRRHEALLEIFDRLEPDEGFVLVNDHDPKPLYYELRSMHGDVVAWEYADRGAGEWRVDVAKTGASAGAAEDVVTRYDVREIPKPERHPTIHHRYGMIPEGGTMEIIAPHEPRPLRGEFRQQYGDAFTWEVVESEPGRCRVQITKGEGGEETGESADTADVEHSCGHHGDGAESKTDDEAIAVTEELDVRDRPPAQRHELIFQAYDDLATGEGFVLVNDHDPKPLYHQFDAEAGPEFSWSYRQREPGEFRVLIGKAENAGDESTDGAVQSPF